VRFPPLLACGGLKPSSRVSLLVHKLSFPILIERQSSCHCVKKNRCLAIINYLIIKYCVQSPCLPVPDSTCVASHILFYLQCVSLCFCPLIVACQLQVLAEDIPTIVSGISFPKSMRWNSNVCVPWMAFMLPMSYYVRGILVIYQMI